MLRTSLILGGLLALSVTTGCYARGGARVSAAYTTPDLVYVGPGVQVVADYDYPVFYSEGFYWRYNNGIWLRSRLYNRGFVRVHRVPVVVRNIRYPHRYVHVRARGHVRARPAARGPAWRRHHR
jgi:hypothetical protein